jgi:ribosome-binding factor A
MKKQRLYRVNSLLKEVIYEVIHESVRNPHINTFVTVTKVETSADLHHAKVYISMIASDLEKEKVRDALETAAGFIAVHASKKVKLRYFPQLTFKIDTTADQHMNIESILNKIDDERKTRVDTKISADDAE